MSKIYCWNGKTRTSQYGEFQTLNLKMSELETYANNWYVNIIVNKRQQEDNYWNDLTVTISQFKPKEVAIAQNTGLTDDSFPEF